MLFNVTLHLQIICAMYPLSELSNLVKSDTKMCLKIAPRDVQSLGGNPQGGRICSHSMEEAFLRIHVMFKRNWKNGEETGAALECL